MSLNDYREEAGEFLRKIGAATDGSEIGKKIDMLEVEFSLLKETSGSPEQFRHQIYDMLFLLFELAADFQFDLDNEWTLGKARKERKYLSGR